jgi:hypothetical protein
MATRKHNIKKDMPASARFIAAGMSLVLFVIGTVVFLMFQPLTWGLMWLGVGAVGLGGDLVHSGIRGKWPFTVECWIYMAE